MVVIYAGVDDSDDAEVVYCPYSCLPLPCHVQCPVAIESWMTVSEYGSVCLDLSECKEAFSNHQHVHTCTRTHKFPSFSIKSVLQLTVSAKPQRSRRSPNDVL